jgi:hypothetical protein
MEHKAGEPFSTVNSEATVWGPAADEAGFKAPFVEHRESYQTTSSGKLPAHSPTHQIPQLVYHAVPLNSPPPTSAHFLEPETIDANKLSPGPEHVQFASYQNEKYDPPRLALPPAAPPRVHQKKDDWMPLPLRNFFWIPLIIILVVGAIGLEVALRISKKNQGWPAGKNEREVLILHYAYTIPPVIIASAIVAMWVWTDTEIKKMQPYVDLVHGDSPPERSLLLDYTRHNNFFVWGRAAGNRHYLVALASLMVLLTFSFQPLASALLVTKETWMQEPDMLVANQRALGLTNSSQFNDLTTFLAGAGYAGAAVMYDLPQPAFVKVPYTVAPYYRPIEVTKNGTVFANTTAVKTMANCVAVNVTMQKHEDGTGWTNSVNHNGCTATFNVDTSSRILFGTDLPNCTTTFSPAYSPVVFWYFSYIPAARAALTFCSPSLSFWEVNVGVDIATGNVTKITELRPFTSSSPFSSTSANVTGGPLNSRAYNGVQFELTNPDRFVLARQSATQLQLPAAVYQAANQSPDGFSNSFEKDKLTALSEKNYSMYLSLIARELYFVPNTESVNVQVKTFRNRVFLSDVAVHLLATAMLILAFFATIVHIFHREDRRHLHLKHEPGTIASAVAIGSQTGVAEVLADAPREKDIKEALKDKKFRFDPTTNKIVMDGEHGYEDLHSPIYRRQSRIVQILHGPPRKPSLGPSGLSNPTTPVTTQSQQEQGTTPTRPNLTPVRHSST